MRVSCISGIFLFDLDVAVANCDLKQQQLQKLGYGIGMVQFDNAPSNEEPKRAGRKSKVLDQDFVKLVGSMPYRYCSDSSKVICVWRNKEKELVCAKLLSKNMWRIWKAEPSLRNKLSWSTFRKTFRSPQRKIDTCNHCKTLKRKIVPRAEAEYTKRGQQITEHCPNYFDELHSAPAFAALLKADKPEDIILQARKYIF